EGWPRVRDESSSERVARRPRGPDCTRRNADDPGHRVRSAEGPDGGRLPDGPFLTRPRERESSGSGDAGAEMTGADSTSPRRTLRRVDPTDARNTSSPERVRPRLDVDFRG